MEVGTPLVLDAELIGCRTGEVTVVGRLPRSCGSGQLVLAEGEFLGVLLWRSVIAPGVQLLWREPANRIPPVERQLRDGSWLDELAVSDYEMSTSRLLGCCMGRADLAYELPR